VRVGDREPPNARGTVIIAVVVYFDNDVSETRHLIPAGKDWIGYEDVNGAVFFMTDDEVVENARENERELGHEFGAEPLPGEPTPEEAWAYVDDLWSADPGGRGWHVRIPPNATWVVLRSDEGDSDRGGPEPVFGFREPPVDEGSWEPTGY
jgi:hypothetical protein